MMEGMWQLKKNAVLQRGNTVFGKEQKECRRIAESILVGDASTQLAAARGPTPRGERFEGSDWG